MQWPSMAFDGFFTAFNPLDFKGFASIMQYFPGIFQKFPGFSTKFRTYDNSKVDRGLCVYLNVMISVVHFWDYLEIACWYWPDLARIQATKLRLCRISLNFK